MSSRGTFGLSLSCVLALLVDVSFAGGRSAPAARAQSADAAEYSPAATQPAVKVAAVDDAMEYLGTVQRPGSDAARQGRAAPGQRTQAPGAPAANNRRANGEGVASRPADVGPQGPMPLSCFNTPWFQQGGPRIPQHQREFSNYRYFGGLPNAYGYGSDWDSYGFSDPQGDSYRFGFLQGMDFGRFEQESNERTESNLAHASIHLDRGLELFKSGRYREASDAFRLAADTNQGDPAARLYAAHSLFAIGRYQEAVAYLRRAFELQPRLVYLNFDIRDDYRNRADYDAQLKALDKAIAQSPTNLDRLILLGYLRYYTKQRDRAYEPLMRAAAIHPNDSLVVPLLENSRPPDVSFDRPVKK